MTQVFVIGDMNRFERNNPELKCIEMENIAAVPGKESRLRPVPGYVNPFKGRGMTYGEIGCFEAHLKTWTRALEKGKKDGEEFKKGVGYKAVGFKAVGFKAVGFKALIFEDDARVNDIGSMFREINESKADITYLAHKLIRPRVAMWSCAYLATHKALEELVSMASEMGGAYPSDEFIAATAIHRSLETRYAMPQPCSPGKDSKESSTEKSPVCPGVPEYRNLRLVTVATSEDNQLTGLLKDTALLYNWPPVEVLGIGTEWVSGDMRTGPGGWQKISLMLEYLENEKEGDDDEDVIVFVDGYDVVMNGPFDGDIVTYCRKSGVIFGAERYCWPRSAELKRAYDIKRSGTNYLNSGCYVGFRRDVKRAVARANELCAGDDQEAFARVYLEDDRIHLDADRRIFLNLNGAEYDFDRSTGCVVTKPENRRPIAVHANGPADTKAMLCQAYVAQYWSPEVYGITCTDKIEAKMMTGTKRTAILQNGDNEDEDPFPNGDPFQGFSGTALLLPTTKGHRLSRDEYEGGVHTVEGITEAIDWCKKRNVEVLVHARNEAEAKSMLEKLHPAMPIIVSSADAVAEKGLHSEEPYAMPDCRFRDRPSFAMLLAYSKGVDPSIPGWASEQALASGLVPRVAATHCHHDHHRPATYAKEILYHPHEGDIKLYSERMFPDVYRISLLSPEFCAWLVDRANGCDKWSSGTSHYDPRIRGGTENVPTRDVHIKDIPGAREAYPEIFSRMRSAVSGLYDGYEVTKTNLAFVVKYEARARDTCYLRSHFDASTVTFVTCLNSDFEGGSTAFVRYGKCPKLSPGEAICHPGRLTHKHGATRTTRGTRYVLVAFLE